MYGETSQGWRGFSVVAWVATAAAVCAGCAGTEKKDGDEAQATPWYETVTAGSAQPSSTAAKAMDRTAALSELLGTETFADEFVGYEQVTSRQVEAFRVLLDQPDAAEVFTELLERGSTAGQLYALCGLYLTDREQFEAALPSYLESEQSVRRAAGGLVWTSPVAEVVGRSRLDQAGRDIVSGAYPRAFAGWGQMAGVN